MLRDFRKNKLFTRRTFILGSIKSSLIGLLIARLGYLQIFKHKQYSTLADSNRIKPVINPAPRGVILDRNNIALTNNKQNYRLLLYLENKSDIKTTLETLTEILALDIQIQNMIAARLKNARRKSIISLIDNLSWDDLVRVEVNSYRLPGISIENGIIRNYPFPETTANFVGYVSLPSETEIDEDNQGLFMHPDFRIGKSGVEKTFDQYLRGKFGVKYVEVNAFGIPIRTLSTKDSMEGEKLHLTIDLRLQKFVSERIKNDVASVVVMNVKTGEIIAFASSPSFNPNNFVEGVSPDYWQELTNDPKKPLSNKVISAIYPPGSTFKLMVALAALEAGINPANRVYCNGSYRLGKRVFHCWKKEGHGFSNMSDAIAHSCNVFFFTTANMIGIDRIAEMARRFGYGEKFDIDLPGGKSGVVPSNEWKKKIFNQPWVGGDTLNTAIGQGFVLATPLQLALVAARIANGSVPIRPHLVKNNDHLNQYENLKNKNLVSPHHLDIILDGMRRVVNEPGGTAYFSRIKEDGMSMAGKTGSSQVISKRESQMTKAEIDMNQNHAIFIGFAPVDESKYAISVVVEHGGAGSKAAAPIAHDVLLEAQKLV